MQELTDLLGRALEGVAKDALTQAEGLKAQQKVWLDHLEATNG